MTQTIKLTLTEDQFRVLYNVLTDVGPHVKDPEPAFIELRDYISEEYLMKYARFTLSPAAKAFSEAYPDDWAYWCASEAPEWIEFKKAFDMMIELGFLKEDEFTGV